MASKTSSPSSDSITQDEIYLDFLSKKLNTIDKEITTFLSFKDSKLDSTIKSYINLRILIENTMKYIFIRRLKRGSRI